MNRVYLLPNTLILSLFLILLIKETNPWLILLYILISFLVSVLLLLLKVYFVGKYYLYLKKKGKTINKEKIYRYARKHILFINRLFRMDFEFEGLEKIDPNQVYFITPNHQSNADILVCFEMFEVPILFVSKISLSRVILIKDWMNLLDCSFLDKDDMRGQVEMMRGVVGKIKSGKNVVLFPEGHRTFGPHLDPFKAGAFKVPQKTQVPILPITLNHVYTLRLRYPWRRTKIKAFVHDPIPVERFIDLSTNELAAMVRGIIETKIEAS